MMDLVLWNESSCVLLVSFIIKSLLKNYMIEDIIFLKVI